MRTAGLVLLSCALGAIAALAPARGGEGDAPVPAGPAVPLGDPKPREPRIEVLRKGEGREVRPGDLVLAHLIVKLASSGKLLMDTHLEGQPQTFETGAGNLPGALEQALAGMRVGDHFRIFAPFEQAWGARGYARAVPPRSDVILELELVGFLEIKTDLVKEGSGPLPLPGEYVVVHYTAFLADGSQFDDSRKSETPLVLVMGDGQVIAGWEMTMRKMRPGDRVKATIPWQLAYGAAGRPPLIAPRTDLTYDIERLPLPAIRHEVLTQGEGAPCQPGREILVHFTGTLADGTEFDSSRTRGRPFPLVLGTQRAIPGLELTISRMRVGDRWKFTVPWILGYGPVGRPGVPPKSDLVYDLEVLSMK